MQIVNFGREESIRIGSNWPTVFDVLTVCGHEGYGVYAKAYLYPDNPKSASSHRFVQLRRSIANPSVVALFTVAYSSTEIPDEWADSEILWDSRHDSKEGKDEP